MVLNAATMLWQSKTPHPAEIDMEVLEAAGLPPGVVSMVPGSGRDLAEAALASPENAPPRSGHRDLASPAGPAHGRPAGPGILGAVGERPWLSARCAGTIDSRRPAPGKPKGDRKACSPITR